MKDHNKKIDSKKSVIKYLNKIGIQDITCETEEESGMIHFSFVVTTKNGNTFHFIQTVDIKPHIKNVDVVYFDETGNGRYIYTTEGRFNPHKPKEQ